MPKERKRIKLHGLLSYKIYNIESQINLLIKNLLGKNVLDKIEEISLFKCSNLLSVLLVDQLRSVDDIYTKGIYTNEKYFILSVTNLLNACDEVLEYNEYVDTKVVHRISRIKSTCEKILKLKIYHQNLNLRKYDYDFYNIIQDNLELRKAVQIYSKSYYKESNELNVTYHKGKDGEDFEGDDIIHS
ncbi:hypothetical protein GCM10022423_34970 [Flavobacterium ginsengiterrae]|uniref:HEPN AbiU2-like domain-containing protein n=2 Tax=Flavobacterium ginsengiterrae TaxID=871695 RepID=A0ABP7GW02_9FLAO